MHLFPDEYTIRTPTVLLFVEYVPTNSLEARFFEPPRETSICLKDRVLRNRGKTWLSGGYGVWLKESRVLNDRVFESWYSTALALCTLTRRNSKTEVKRFPSKLRRKTLKTQQSMINLHLCLRKTQVGKSYDYHDAIVFGKLHCR